MPVCRPYCPGTTGLTRISLRAGKFAEEWLRRITRSASFIPQSHSGMRKWTAIRERDSGADLSRAGRGRELGSVLSLRQRELNFEELSAVSNSLLFEPVITVYAPDNRPPVRARGSLISFYLPRALPGIREGRYRATQ